MLVRGQSFSFKPFDRLRSGYQIIGLGARNDFHGPFGQAPPSPLACLPRALRSFNQPRSQVLSNPNPSLQMHTKQNLKSEVFFRVFGFKSDTLVLTFNFILLPPSLPHRRF